MDKGVISFKGDLGHPPNQLAKTVINNAVGLSELDTFAAYLKASVSDCSLNFISWCDRDEKNEAAPGAEVNVDRIAVFVVKESEGTVHKYGIPGPKSTIIEDTPEGERITAAAQSAFATALSACTGLSFSELQGYIIQKK